MSVTVIPAYEHPQKIGLLFQEYTDRLYLHEAGSMKKTGRFAASGFDICFYPARAAVSMAIISSSLVEIGRAHV